MTCATLNELRDDTSPVDILDSNRSKYLTNYIDAYLACNPEQRDSFEMSVIEGSDPNSIANAIVEDMGRHGDEALELLLLQQLTQINASKRPIFPDAQNSQTAQLGTDPVMLFKGQFIHEVRDVHINGAGMDFTFKRTYKNQVIFKGPLGYNWSHNFHVWLRDAGQVVFRATGDLREEAFTRHPRFGETIGGGFDYWMPPDGKHTVILAESDSYVLRLSSGTRQVFERDPRHSFLHRLSRVEDRFGNYLDLHYAEDQLVRVEVNHPRRLVAFKYDAKGRICLIRDFTGREWRYDYDSIGDLVGVGSPATQRHDSGSTVRYDYSSAFHTGELQHNLTRIVDGAGQTYLENEYGSSRGLLDFNRVVRQRQGGGEYRFEYEDVDQVFDADYDDEHRPAHQTILVERNGQPVRHVYNKFGNLLLREQSILQAGLPSSLTQHYRYNRDGSIVASLSPEGAFKQHLFGREYFVRKHGLTANGDVPTDPLTWNERQAFGRVRSTVRRGGYAAFNEFTMTQGIWGNFPDILNGPYPSTLADRSHDIVVKMTYEDEFGQLLTVSDPRYTRSADPDEVNEHPRHAETLTRYIYATPKQLLVGIEYPTPTLPDGSLGDTVTASFTKPDPVNPGLKVPAYDDRGRLQQSTTPGGLVTTYDYFDDPNDLTFGHRRQVVVDPGGFDVTVRNDVDELGRVTAVRLPKSLGADDGRYVTRSVYDELGQVIETTSSTPYGFRTRHFFDRNGMVEREERDLRDENGQPELGGVVVATFCYDQEAHLIQETVGGLDVDGHLVTTHCYDAAGNRSSTRLPNGNELQTHYNERQLADREVFGANSEEAVATRVEHDGDGRVVRTFDARGNQTVRTLDAFDRVLEETDALGHITRTSYDKVGNVVCVRVFERRENGYFLLARREATYDELSRAIRCATNRFEQPIGPFLRSELAGAELDSPGPGELLEVASFCGAQGLVQRSVDPRGRATRYDYDVLDRVIRVVDPLGNESRSQYDLHNNLIRADLTEPVTDDNGIQTGVRHFANAWAYDELDRLIASTDSLGNVTRIFYDSRGNIVRQVDPLENQAQASFDVFGRAVSSTRFLTTTGLGPVAPDSIPATTHHEYDSNGNLTAVIDALGRRTEYRYDALDRRRAVIYPDGTRSVMDYDGDGNVVRVQDNNGVQRLHTVDAIGRTTRVDVELGNIMPGLEVAGATFESYRYDALGRQTRAENDFSVCSFRYDSVGGQLDETLEVMLIDAPVTTPLTIGREFDQVGALVGLTYPNGRRLRLHRDDVGRLVRTQNLINGAGYPGEPGLPEDRTIARMQYQGRQRGRCHFGNGASTAYRYDGAGRITEISQLGSDAPLLGIQYLHDAAGNVRLRSDVRPDGARVERFAYDSMYRLAHEFDPVLTESLALSALEPAVNPLADPIPDRQSEITGLIGSLQLPLLTPFTFEHDLVDNREAETPSGGTTIAYLANELDQYVSRGATNYTYDANGNLKDDEQRLCSYDSLDRLVGVDASGGGEMARFWHDALGRRVLERRLGESTQLICDGNDLIAEYRNGALFSQYVFDDGVDRPLHIAAEGRDHFCHVDLLGSVRLLTDVGGGQAASYRYATYGDLVDVGGADIFNPWRYAARRLDPELDTYDYRARQYDPQTGRFAQRDPEEMVDGTNLYNYAINNPLGFVDPTGTGGEEPSSGSPAGAYSSGLKGLQMAARPMLKTGKLASGRLHLWSNSGVTDAQNAIRSNGSGWMFGETVGHQASETAEVAIRAKHGLTAPRLPKADYVKYIEPIWIKSSKSLARGSAFGLLPVESHYGKYDPNSIQVKYEVPAVKKWGTVTGVASAVSGVTTIYSAAKSENVVVQILGVVGGTNEVTGAGIWIAGVRTGTPLLMKYGSFLMRYGGGTGLTAISAFSLYGDVRRGDVQAAVGDAGGTATGILILLGSAWAAPAGAGTVGYYAGGFIDEKTGWSNALSRRAKASRDQYRDGLGLGEWGSTILGAPTTVPIVSEVGDGIGFVAAETVMSAQRGWNSLSNDVDWERTAKFWKW